MKPVDQTTYGLNNGNCFSACIASILEIPLEEVPLFLGAHWPGFAPWLAERGLAASIYRSEVYVPRGYSIAGGQSLRFAGRNHACVARDGAVVHDPHFSRDGLPFGVTAYVVLHGPRREPMWFSA